MDRKTLDTQGFSGPFFTFPLCFQAFRDFANLRRFLENGETLGGHLKKQLAFPLTLDNFIERGKANDNRRTICGYNIGISRYCVH